LPTFFHALVAEECAFSCRFYRSFVVDKENGCRRTYRRIQELEHQNFFGLLYAPLGWKTSTNSMGEQHALLFHCDAQIPRRIFQ
jgi:hypothetical protein